MRKLVKPTGPVQLFRRAEDQLLVARGLLEMLDQVGAPGPEVVVSVVGRDRFAARDFAPRSGPDLRLRRGKVGQEPVGEISTGGSQREGTGGQEFQAVGRPQ